MTTTLEPTPTGRPCTVCRRPDLDEIHAALADGATYRAVSDAFGPLSRNAVRRHAMSHLPNAIEREIYEAQGATNTTLLERVVDVARSAREAREEAMQAGHHNVALRAGDAELRALSALASLGIKHEDEVDARLDARMLLTVMRRAIRQSPELGEVVAREFEAMDQLSIAAVVREGVSRNREIAS